MLTRTDSIRDNLAAVRERMERAASRAGRSAAGLLLVAVSKEQCVERIRAAYEAGQRHFGESRIQEFEQKCGQLKLPGVEWHMVGHLQSNKARRAAELFQVIESVDSERLALRLDAAAKWLARRLPVFIEVKLSPEPTKSGCLEQNLPRLVDCVRGHAGLELRGLMTVPPLTEDPDGARPYFRCLRRWAEHLGVSELSMGMSHDFEVAIEEGATLVRVGTAIFGERQ